MIVNLYTDAGVKSGVATWGAVCAPPGRASVERCGRMRDDLKDTTAAELRAMANGLHAMLRAGVIERGDEVRIFCDNMRAVEVVNGAPLLRLKTRERHGIAVQKLRAMAEDAGIVVVARNVASHQPLKSKCPHAASNRRADELCTLARRNDYRPSKPKPAGPNKAQRALAIARQLEGRA